MNYFPDNQPPINGGFIAAIVVFYVVLIVFFGWMYVRIIRRTGYSGWWVLMALVPIGNIVMLILFAFKEWPILRELNYLRGYAAHTGLPGYAGTPAYPAGAQPVGDHAPPEVGPSPWQQPPPEAPGTPNDPSAT